MLTFPAPSRGRMSHPSINSVASEQWSCKRKKENIDKRHIFLYVPEKDESKTICDISIRMRSLTTIKIPSFWYYHWLIYWFLVVTSEVKEGHAIEDSSSPTTTTSVAVITTTTEKIPTLVFEEPMKNYTKYAGETLKIKCVVRGHPPAKTIKWFKNEAERSKMDKKQPSEA